MSKAKRRLIKKLKSIPRCGLCGKVDKLRRTECCGNLICDDWTEYVPFSFSTVSCSRNHDRYTVCAFHHTAEHSGDWINCDVCRTEIEPTETYVFFGTNEFNFRTLSVIPDFEPTLCADCGRRIVLSFESYTRKGDECYCSDCHELIDFSMFAKKD